MTTSWWALLAALTATLVLGVLWRVREGRVRQGKNSENGHSLFDAMPDQLRQQLAAGHEGAQVTLVQFSTTFCAPCRHARILLGDFAQRTDGVRHVEVDLTDHPEWSTPLRVHRTPTTLALDPSGRELFRVGGVPRRDDLAEALRQHLS